MGTLTARTVLGYLTASIKYRKEIVEQEQIKNNQHEDTELSKLLYGKGVKEQHETIQQTILLLVVELISKTTLEQIPIDFKLDLNLSELAAHTRLYIFNKKKYNNIFDPLLYGENHLNKQVIEKKKELNRLDDVNTSIMLDNLKRCSIKDLTALTLDIKRSDNQILGKGTIVMRDITIDFNLTKSSETCTQLGTDYLTDLCNNFEYIPTNYETKYLN